MVEQDVHFGSAGACQLVLDDHPFLVEVHQELALIDDPGCGSPGGGGVPRSWRGCGRLASCFREGLLLAASRSISSARGGACRSRRPMARMTCGFAGTVSGIGVAWRMLTTLWARLVLNPARVSG